MKNENFDDTPTTSEDLDALRELLHNVRGINVVSADNAYVPSDDGAEQ